MMLSNLVVIFWHFRVPRGQRVFHQIAVIILTTMAIAYFAMASDLGATPINTEYSHHGRSSGVSRQIWYVRYIAWTIATPALELVLASGLPLSDIITLLFFDIVMIVTRLVDALVVSSYKWGFYTFGLAALFYIWWVLLWPGRASAGVIGTDYRRTFTMSAAYISFIWLLYPICWGMSNGGNVISPTSEMVFYGILDILSMPIFCFIHLFALSRLDLTALQLYTGKFSTSAVGDSVYDREKAARPIGTGAPGTTAAALAGATTGTVGTRKQGLSSRRGQHDAPATGTNRATTASVGTENAPRPSEATVTSQ